jgi:uncharacterized MAPEG superfamily protein
MSSNIGGNMTIAFWCVLIAGLLPYIAALTAKAGARFDNKNPRDWLAKQEGYRRRANAAQANAFEAFPLFAAAVIVAALVQAPQERVDLLAMSFVVARAAYFGFYLLDWAVPRSAAWFAGIGCAVAIFVAGA